MTRILLFDDQDSRLRKMNSLIEGTNADVEVTKVAPTDFISLMKKLAAARRESHKAKGDRETILIDDLDEADLVVIDQDLTELPEEESLLEGDYVAKLFRTYSRAGAIVSINRWSSRTFQLVHNLHTLRGADLELHIDDLGRPSLWGEKPEGYAPWYWPNLLQLSEDYRRRVDLVRAGWKKPVAEVLRLKEEDAPLLPPEHPLLPLAWRNQTSESLAETIIPIKEYATTSPESRHRLVASVLGTWLNNFVVPKQSHLVDAPHLARLTPSLFKETEDTQARLVSKTDFNLTGDERVLERHSANLQPWLDRPAYWTRRVLTDERLADVSKPWDRKNWNRVFAEDTSRFHRRQDTEEYIAEGQFTTRFVNMRNRLKGDVDYQPAPRFAVAEKTPA